MSEPRQDMNDYDLLTVNLIDSLITRVDAILARDLSTSAHSSVQQALSRFNNAKSIELLLDRAANAATIIQFDVDIKE